MTVEFTHFVVIDDERYCVPDDVGMKAIRQEMLDAVHTSGSYVALGRPGVGYTEVLITGMSSVRIEHVVRDDAPTVETGDSDSDNGLDPGWWA